LASGISSNSFGAFRMLCGYRSDVAVRWFETKISVTIQSVIPKTLGCYARKPKLRGSKIFGIKKPDFLHGAFFFHIFVPMELHRLSGDGSLRVPLRGEKWLLLPDFAGFSTSSIPAEGLSIVGRFGGVRPL
jgi:hypothetical protein